MVKHGEYARFLSLKFEKNENICKNVAQRGFEPRPPGWKSGMLTTRPRRQIQIWMDIMLYEYVKN